MRRPRKVVGLAAANGKIGFAYLSDGELLDWGLAVKASKSVEAAYDRAKAWLSFYRPDIVVVEEIDQHSRKGPHAKALIETFGGAAYRLRLKRVAVKRPRRYPNKYIEARALADEFPQLEPWLPPPRKSWNPEKPRLIYFEALALAKEWLSQGRAGARKSDGD